jgi:uncharacterized membrane protein
MAFCASCGSQVEGRFCAKCGTPVGAAPPNPGQAVPPPPGAPQGYVQQPVPLATAAPMADNVAGALCYSLGFITGIIFLIMEPYSRNPAVRFHAFQSIFMSVALIAVRIVLSIIFGILMGISGVFMGLALFSLYGLFCFILWLYMIIMTYQGKTVVLPIIGPIAQKQ